MRLMKINIAMLALYFVFTVLFTLSRCDANGKNIEFTPEEQAYIHSNGKVTVCVDPDWIPFEWINEQGNHQGISADLLKLVSERTGIQFALVKTTTWDESINLSQAGKCQVLSFLNRTSEREKWLIFSDTLLSDPSVFITREEHAFIADPAYLADETIVFPVGTATEELIRERYPNLRIITVATEKEAIQMVSDKKADMTMRSLIVAAYTIKKEGLFNLKVAGQMPNFTSNLRIGIQKDNVILRDILNKGISTITPQEKWEIINKHISINVQTVTDYSLVFKIVIAFCLLGFIGLYRHHEMKKINQQLIKISQTDTLTGLPNRLKLDAELSAEFARAKRYGRPFSIIIFDIDNFKKINDELGHLMGDKVLQEIARIVPLNLRPGDVLGRWGGEEFLVLCPETDAQAAYRVADRMRSAIQNHSFATHKQHTVSAGIAALSSADTIDSLLNRADTSMYQAKFSGKNQVCPVLK